MCHMGKGNNPASALTETSILLYTDGHTDRQTDSSISPKSFFFCRDIMNTVATTLNNPQKDLSMATSNCFIASFF